MHLIGVPSQIFFLIKQLFLQCRNGIAVFEKCISYPKLKPVYQWNWCTIGTLDSYKPTSLGSVEPQTLKQQSQSQQTWGLKHR